MAFALRNLSVLAYANGFTLWHYRAGADSQAEISGQGFFEEAGDLLSAGDMLMVSAPDGGRILCVVREPAGLRLAALA